MMDVILAVAWVIMTVSFVGLMIMCRRYEKMLDDAFEGWDETIEALLKSSAELYLAKKEIERLKGAKEDAE